MIVRNEKLQYFVDYYQNIWNKTKGDGFNKSLALFKHYCGYGKYITYTRSNHHNAAICKVLDIFCGPGAQPQERNTYYLLQLVLKNIDRKAIKPNGGLSGILEVIKMNTGIDRDKVVDACLNHSLNSDEVIDFIKNNKDDADKKSIVINENHLDGFKAKYSSKLYLDLYKKQNSPDNWSIIEEKFLASFKPDFDEVLYLLINDFKTIKRLKRTEDFFFIFDHILSTKNINLEKRFQETIYVSSFTTQHKWMFSKYNIHHGETPEDEIHGQRFNRAYFYVSTISLLEKIFANLGKLSRYIHSHYDVLSLRNIYLIEFYAYMGMINQLVFYYPACVKPTKDDSMGYLSRSLQSLRDCVSMTTKDINQLDFIDNIIGIVNKDKCRYYADNFITFFSGSVDNNSPLKPLPKEVFGIIAKKVIKSSL